MSSQACVQIKHLTFSRGSRKIFDDLSLDVPRGSIVGIMGPSGTGKTTLLRLISGQLSPDQGSIFLDDDEINTLSRSRLYQVRKKMGMLFQSNALFTNLSVFDNIAYPLRERADLSEAFIRDIVLMKLQAVGLRGARHLMPSDLSGGMARRVALARAIAMDPELIMYDEPFTGQDPISVGMIVKLMRLLNKSANMTSIIVSHDIEITFNLVDYVFVLADGKIIGQGKPDELRNSANAQVRQFLNGLPDGPVPFHYPAKDYATDLMGEN
ncbi:MAG: ATP-binding cassette domain-containing protein [Pseudomonadota bacterium]